MNNKIWSKRYVVIYIDTSYSKNNYGILQGFDKEQSEEFDDKSICNNFVKELQICNLKYIIIDRDRRKIIENTFTNNKFSSNVMYNYSLLEHYIGDNKTVEYFIDKKTQDLYYLAQANNRYAKDFIFDAQFKYKKYLEDTWGSKKDKKKLPNLQIYDNPHMVKEEINALKKEEKDKLKLITEKSGW